MAQTAGICPANETIVTSQNAEVNWKKTHVAIINGDDYEDRHKKNAGLAAKAAIGKGCATVHVAGQMENTTGDIKTYGGTSAGVTAMIQAIGKSSAEGETVLIYVTGHGAENGFGLEKSEGIEHKDFLKLLEDNFSGRRIVFIADSCYSAAFVNMIMESGKLKDVIAMSPGLKNEETSCEYFSYPFWHAIIKGLDVNGNGLATLDEAFYYALRKYREVKPGTDGTYRETLPTVKTIEEVRDGVIMITTDWCGSCKAMYPTFNLTKVRLKGMVEFYAMDVTEGGFDGPVPTLIIRKAGKTVAKSVGAMGFKEFTKWLAKNGVRAGQDGISLKDLYEQGRFDSIVQIFSWQEIRKEIGEQQAA
jgi:thiol-disulfide isomerase/thioredoxin